MRASFKRSIIAIGFLALIFPGASRAEIDPEERFRQVYYHKLADRLFNAGEVPGNLEMALKYYQKAFKTARKQNESWKIVRCRWALAKTASDKSERLRHIQKGTKHGKATIKNSPDNPDAYLWHFMIMESGAIERGTANTPRMRSKIRKGFEKVLELNPESVEAYLGLGGWHFDAPDALGGDKAKAFKLVEKALKISPDHSSALLLKANFFIKEQNNRQALKILKHLSKTTSPASGRDIQDKAEAEELIRRLGK